MLNELNLLSGCDGINVVMSEGGLFQFYGEKRRRIEASIPKSVSIYDWKSFLNIETASGKHFTNQFSNKYKRIQITENLFFILNGWNLLNLSSFFISYLWHLQHCVIDECCLNIMGKIECLKHFDNSSFIKSFEAIFENCLLWGISREEAPSTEEKY